MHSGWIKLHRKSIDSAVFTDPTLFMLWCLCLISANWKDSWAKIDGLNQPILVPRGSFIAGRFSLHAMMYPKLKNRKKLPDGSNVLSPSTLWRRLETLESMQNLNIKSNNKFSIVTICNYETYQSDDSDFEQQSEQQVNSRRTADEQQTRTSEEGKERKERKEPPQTPKGVVVNFPSELDTPELRVAWGEWEQHRIDIKKPMTPLARQKTIKKLLALGVEESIRWIDNAIEKSWQGLYQPSTNGNSNGHADADVTTFIDLRKTTPKKNVV